jgi:hypothetical protein
MCNRTFTIVPGATLAKNVRFIALPALWSSLQRLSPERVSIQPIAPSFLSTFRPSPFLAAWLAAFFLEPSKSDDFHLHPFKEAASN